MTGPLSPWRAEGWNGRFERRFAQRHGELKLLSERVSRMLVLSIEANRVERFVRMPWYRRWWTMVRKR